MRNLLSRLCNRARIALPLAGLALWFVYTPAHAATFSVGASKTSVTVGETITISAYIDTQGKTINNGEAAILFPPSLVEATSASSAGSIFSIWVQSPSVGSGSVSFNGGVPNPGYSGTGKVATTTFTAKTAGEATFSFSSTAIRENDGLGTNIYTGANSVTVTIANPTSTPAAPTPPATPATPPKTSSPTVPAISSTTHPDQSTWYAANTAHVMWTVGSGTMAVQTSVTESPTSTPSGESRGVFTQQDIADLADGTWYVHVRAYGSGGWSSPAHFTLLVDTQGPTDTTVTPGISEDGYTTLTLSAADAHAGVDHADITIDGTAVGTYTADTFDQPIVLPAQTLGAHTIVTHFVDTAGNATDVSTAVTVAPTAAPSITSASSTIAFGSTAMFTGTAPYANASIVIQLTDATGERSTITATTDATGAFSATTAPFEHDGIHHFSAYVAGLDGQRGPTSTEQSFTISAQATAGPIISIRIDLTLIQLLIGLTGLLAILLTYTCIKIVILKRKLRIITHSHE